MATPLKRKNAAMLEFARAGFLTVVTYLALAGLDFRPIWGAAVLALVAGALTLVAFDLGALVAVLSISLPILAVAPVVGILFLVLTLVSLRYLGAAGGTLFIVASVAAASAFVGPAWAIVGVAGYVLGLKRGAIAAALGCVVVELMGFALGRSAIGMVATAGERALVNLDKMPESLVSAAWVGQAVERINGAAVERVYTAASGLPNLPGLVLQPMLWAVGAIVTAKVASVLWQGGRAGLAPLAAAVGVAVPALGAVAVGSLAGLPHGTVDVATTLATSAAVAVALSYTWDYLFPVLTPEPPAVQPQVTSMAAEDEDVDELLRLIATAEEKVATQYTTVKTVMITDMKSFSRMTEEYGSAVTAKAVQRHRDLLLPVIQQHGGCGKSTGGDGLIAAFDDAASAVGAAVEMQQVLAEHNRNHPYESEVTVRVGVAYGEVVLDRGGRPFIGNALNVAARIMNLADGGQAFTTATVVGRAGLPVATHSHGTFELKNIDKPVEVIELLWHEGQEPIDPRTHAAT